MDTILSPWFVVHWLSSLRTNNNEHQSLRMLIDRRDCCMWFSFSFESWDSLFSLFDWIYFVFPYHWLHSFDNTCICYSNKHSIKVARYHFCSRFSTSIFHFCSSFKTTTILVQINIWFTSKLFKFSAEERFDVISLKTSALILESGPLFQLTEMVC